MKVTMTTMVVVRIIQVHENACPPPQTSLSPPPSLSLFLSTFRKIMWMFLIGYKGYEDPFGDDLGGSSLGSDVDTGEGIYRVIA